MKIGFEKIMGYPCSSLATKWKLQCIRPTTNTKRFRKFCVRLTHLGTNFAPISHQILHLEKKFPKVYLIRTPSVSLPTAANPALKFSKWPASRQCTNRATLYERSNHCGTESDYLVSKQKDASLVTGSNPFILEEDRRSSIVFSHHDFFVLFRGVGILRNLSNFQLSFMV